MAAKKKPLKGPNLSSYYVINHDQGVHVNQPPPIDADGHKRYSYMWNRGTIRQLGVANMDMSSKDPYPYIFIYGHTQVSDAPHFTPTSGPANGLMLTIPVAEQLVAMLLHALYGNVEA